MPVISFASSKGGAGKTTACIVMASEVAQSTSVTIIDADPAQRLMRWSKKGPLPKGVSVVSCIDERVIMDAITDALTRSVVVLLDLEGVSSRLNTYAILNSDLVIVPTSDEQQEAEDAIETLNQVKMDGRSANRAIETRVLFSRTKAAVKSAMEKEINAELRANVNCFATELVTRTAYSNLHKQGGGLRTLQGLKPDALEKAINNAETFAGEVLDILLTEGQAA